MVFFLRELFFPWGCALCGSSLLNMEETWYGLCDTCKAELDKETSWLHFTDKLSIAQERCDKCGRPLISEQNRCLSCRNNEERNFDRMLVIFPYTGKYQKLFGVYKFEKNLALGHFFAEKLTETLALLKNLEFSGTDDKNAPMVIVPVPPRPGKVKKTGWDQVEYITSLLEKGIKTGTTAANTNYLIYRCLKRLPSKIQKKLDRKDRLKNLQNRIILKKQAPPAAVIIDDVITTGSTMDVCAQVLKTGGSRKVYGICLVYD